MATAPKVTFGNKSASANFATNPQFSSSANQNLVTNFNPSGNYQYAANQIISGQPAQYTAASPSYEYRSNQPDVRIGSGDFNQYRNTGAPVKVIPQTTVVRQTRLNEEIQRPQYSKVNQNGQPSKKLAPDTDPRPDTPICSPFWWILGALIALALLTLALLFGLGVIGGSHNNNSSPPVAAASGSPSNAGASGISGPSGKSGAIGTSGASGNSGASSPSSQVGTSGINNGKTSSGNSSNSGSPASTNSGIPSGSSAPNPQTISSSQGSSGTSTSANNGVSSSNGVNGVTGVSPIPYNPSNPSPTPNTKPAVIQSASIQLATVAPVVVSPVSLQVKVANSTSPTVSTPSSTKI